MPTPTASALTTLRLRPTAALIAENRERLKRLDALLAEVRKTNAQIQRDWEAWCRQEPPF